MLEQVIQLSIMSGGLLPLMGVLLLITLAVIVERAYFFRRALKSGLAMEHDLHLIEYQNVEKLEQLEAHYEGFVCSARSFPPRWRRVETTSIRWTGISMRRSCGRCPRSTRTSGCSIPR